MAQESSSMDSLLSAPRLLVTPEPESLVPDSSVPESSVLQPLVMPSEQTGRVQESDKEDEDKRRMREQFDNTVCEELQIPDNYSNVAVLIIHWVAHLDEDLHCHKEVEELKTVFEKRFNFHSKVLTLHDGKRPQAQLEHGLTELVLNHEGSCRSNLLIVYYTGHGFPRDDYGLDISGFRSRNHISTAKHAAIANWNDAEKCLMSADADVLTILDTCFAGNIFKGGVEDVRTYQVLAAAGRNKATSPPGEHSFTRALIDVLNDKLDEKDSRPFTAFDLHCAIMSRRRDMNSSFFPRFSGGNSRPIKLAPLRKTETAVTPSTRRDASHLTLRFAFEDTVSLNNEQIASLAREISSGVRRTDLNVQAIDFLDFKKTEAESRIARENHLRNFFGFVVHSRRWSQRQKKRRASYASEDDGPPLKKRKSSTAASPSSFEPLSPSTSPLNESGSSFT